MNIYGYEITQWQQSAAIQHMKEHSPFKAFQIERVLRDAGVPQSFGKFNGFVSHRAADRIIQKQRKAGNIRFAGNEWRWVGNK